VDVITPTAQTEFMKQALEVHVPVEVCAIDGAGHFSFMNEPPPQTTDPFFYRHHFHADLAAVVIS
jgi:hypothetical protein